MKQAFVLVVCSLFANCVKPVLGRVDAECVTPDLQPGNCTSIFECPSFVNALPTANEEERQFMKISECGWVGRAHPKVCCGPSTFFKPNTRFLEVPRDEILLPDKSLCGFEEEPNKVIGGTNAGITDFPWSALLKYVDNYNRKEYRCGGALISKRYVLTAAHCLREDLRSVRLGETDLSQPKDCQNGICNEPFEVEVEYTVPHPLYNQTGYFNDIALIRLKNPVPFTRFVQPICLPEGSTKRSKPRVELRMAGWGITNETLSEGSPIKQIAKMPIISLKNCDKMFRKKRIHATLQNTNVCAGALTNKSTCKGDSGGPLVAKTKGNQNYVEAVLSFGGPNACAKDVPAAFTLVIKYLDWIKKSIRP